MKLYTIQDQIEVILGTCVDYETGEIEEIAAEKLNELEGDKNEMILDLACAAKGELAEATAVDEEIKKLRVRQAIHNKRAAWITKQVEEWVEEGEKLSDGRVAIVWRKSTAITIVDPGKIPKMFLRKIPAKYEPDKTKIKEVLLDVGPLEIPGAVLEERNNMRIK